ncbi:hypothetical protein ARMSODRAFT_978345 [Armillaria solidipes]|uniref:Uncharacterized protein n=1 Tax=Armillaria solidipes TaxID=1076256 RepID=A0A2H3B2S8_9AGAR|nr:hypothetical protein ARMSODRAFT_978345 [Armillaria solidipes]
MWRIVMLNCDLSFHRCYLVSALLLSHDSTYEVGCEFDPRGLRTKPLGGGGFATDVRVRVLGHFLCRGCCSHMVFSVWPEIEFSPPKSDFQETETRLRKRFQLREQFPSSFLRAEIIGSQECYR